MSIPYLDTNNLLIIVIFALFSLFSFLEGQDYENKNKCKYVTRTSISLKARQSGIIIQYSFPLLAVFGIIYIPEQSLCYLNECITYFND